MYYNPPPQSPGLAHKLPAHHEQNPWNRSHHSVLSASIAGPSAAPPPPSPGYAMYTNGNTMQHHPHPHPPQMHQHHHQNSLSHVPYPSPPNPHPHALGQGSPTSTSSQIITPHWQQQLLKYDVSSCYTGFSLYSTGSADKPCFSFAPSPCTRECHGLPYGGQICNRYHKSQCGQDGWNERRRHSF